VSGLAAAIGECVGVTSVTSRMRYDLTMYASSLGLGADGIWHAKEDKLVSYPIDGNDQCFEVENQSFWFQHRNACIVELVKKFPPRGKGPIFDIGGGNGFVGKALVDAGWDVVLVEPGPAGARNAKKRGLRHVVCATTQAAGFRNESMPAIGVFDVVEHIENDEDFLKHLHDLLEPGGMLYLTVPSYNFLWSSADIAARHFRRYNLGDLRRKLRDASFSILFASYFFRILPVGVFFYRSLPFRLGLTVRSANPRQMQREHGAADGFAVKTLRMILASECGSIRRGKEMVFGGSCLVAASRSR